MILFFNGRRGLLERIDGLIEKKNVFLRFARGRATIVWTVSRSAMV